MLKALHPSKKMTIVIKKKNKKTNSQASSLQIFFFAFLETCHDLGHLVISNLVLRLKDQGWRNRAYNRGMRKECVCVCVGVEEKAIKNKLTIFRWQELVEELRGSEN